MTAIVSLFWPKRNVTKVLTQKPSTITIVGKDYVGTASCTVSSALSNVGAIYDYTAKITWTREGPLVPGAPVIYRPHGYVKYTPRNRCVSNMQPDSITISPLEATLEVHLDDQTWSVGGLPGLAAPAIQYFDTCAKMPSYLEVTAAPYIQGDGSEHLPVTGQISLDYGIKITGRFSYLREGESSGQGVNARGVRAAR